jgi:hypothetical protein
LIIDDNYPWHAVNIQRADAEVVKLKLLVPTAFLVTEDGLERADAEVVLHHDKINLG